jgi:hypothetical protein
MSFQRNAFQTWAFQVSDPPVWYGDFGPPAQPSNTINVALTTNGGVATASSTYSGALYGSSNVNNGDVIGGLWGKAGGGWNDATINVWGDWLQVTFNRAYRINQIDVVTLQNGFALATPIDLTTSSSTYGLTAYDVQYWNGTAWVTIQIVTGNNKAWRQFTFSVVTTDRIRIVCNAGVQYGRLVEVMAYSPIGGVSRGRTLVGTSRGRISCGC